MSRSNPLPISNIFPLLLGLIILVLAANPTWAQGPSGTQETGQRALSRPQLVLPIVQNHHLVPGDTASGLQGLGLNNRVPSSHSPRLSAPAVPITASPAPAKRMKFRLLCPGCPGDEHTAVPQRSSSQVIPGVNRPGPPHPPPIIADGAWPPPEWPPHRSGKPIIIYPPPRHDFPLPTQAPAFRIKPRRR